MIACQHPFVESLADGKVFAGMLERDLLSLHTPEWTEMYGSYTTFGFMPQGYDYVTISTVNGRVTSARAGSCTWCWTFFEKTPNDVLESVHAIKSLRRAIGRSPSCESVLRPILWAQCVKLGIDPPAQPKDGG